MIVWDLGVRSFVDREKKLVLVGISAIMCAIWKCRNDITFRDRKINDPMTLIKLTCNWLLDWAVLQEKPLEQNLMMLGAEGNMP